MRVCIVYDCLYPYTVGGAERWYRNLAEQLATRGHSVTYLTLRQWPEGEEAAVPGVEVRAVGPRMDLYSGGTRRILPALVFGAGVFLHLLRRGRRYDVVHTGSFPYFGLLVAAVARRLHRYRLFVDWIEIWTAAYWREYLGTLAGTVGWWIQRAAIRTRHRAFCFARLHADRLQALGYRGNVVVLDGLYAGGARPPQPAEPVVVFAGRHIPEKRVPALVPALVEARGRVPELEAEIYGDGPDREQVVRLVEESGMNGAVRVPGFVAAEEIQRAVSRALCLALPSRREGYGLVVVEAAAAGTPSIVVRDPDNAAAELVDEGENGFLAPSAAPSDLADAIVRVYERGEELRASTREWYARNERRLSIETSVERVIAAYEDE
jgi:glycosyltransferase involved in cell wall biosynthesis